MTKRSNSFNVLPWIVGSLAIVAILLIIRNTEPIPDRADSQENKISNPGNGAENRNDSLSATAIEAEKVPSVSFLNLDEEELSALPEEMADFYNAILSTKNFASGISIFPLMKMLNQMVNDELVEKEIEAFSNEKELFKSMEGLKVNPRVTAGHFNQSGRIILKKFYRLQANAYPKLANQLREVKSALSEAPSRGSLEGHGPQVKEFFDESFVFFYLVWEEKETQK